MRIQVAALALIGYVMTASAETVRKSRSVLLDSVITSTDVKVKASQQANLFAKPKVLTYTSYYYDSAYGQSGYYSSDGYSYYSSGYSTPGPNSTYTTYYGSYDYSYGEGYYGSYNSYYYSYSSADQKELNETVVQNAVRDTAEFLDLADSTLGDERAAVAEAIVDGYKNIVGKLILNLGNLIYPIINAEAQLIGNLTLNSNCQLDDAVNECVSLNDDFKFRIDGQCLQAYNCTMLIMDNRGNITELVNNIEDAKQDSARYVQRDILEPAAEGVAEAIQNYQEAANNLTDEFADLVRQYANPVFGCDQVCIDQCLDNVHGHINHIPDCIKYECPCYGARPDFGQGQYNYYSLMQYNNHNAKAWKFFKNMQAKI